MGSRPNMIPIVSKIFCSPSQATLVVRKRPPIINGGGFVVTDINQKAVFSAEGCGTLGARGELLVRDGDGEPILFIRKKGGILQALSANNHWKGYLMEYEGIGRSVFSIKEPKSFLAKNAVIKITISNGARGKEWDFEVKGSFPDRSCAVIERSGNVIAQVVMMDQEMMPSKDVYNVVVQPGHDQAFVVGVIAVLDNIYGESTRC